MKNKHRRETVLILGKKKKLHEIILQLIKSPGHKSGGEIIMLIHKKKKFEAMHYSYMYLSIRKDTLHKIPVVENHC